MKKAVVFDFDGTLVDSFDLINRCLCETVGHFKNIIIPLEKAKEYFKFGPTEEGILQKSLTSNHKEAYIYFLNLYNSYHNEYFPKTLDQELINIFSLIHENGCKVILLTGRGKETLSISLAKLDAFKYFDGFYTGSTLGEVKCELLNELMEEYGFSNDEIAYVGDSYRDTLSCKKAKVDCITVTYFNKECMKKPDDVKQSFTIANSISELKNIISEVLKKQ